MGLQCFLERMGRGVCAPRFRAPQLLGQDFIPKDSLAVSRYAKTQPNSLSQIDLTPAVFLAARMYCEVVFSTCEPEIRDKSKGPRIPSNLHQGQRSELLKVLLQQRSRITSFVIRPEARVIQDVTTRKTSRSAPRLWRCFSNPPTSSNNKVTNPSLWIWPWIKAKPWKPFF